MNKGKIKELAYKLASVMQHVPNSIGTTSGFYKNFYDMNSLPWMDSLDKYFHSKANFNAGSHYDFPTATILDIGKEIYDIPRKTWFEPNGLGLRKNYEDSLEDLGADFYGLFQGALHPLGNPKELLKKYRPKNLDGRY